MAEVVTVEESVALAIRSLVESLLSKENLKSDSHIASIINPQWYVPLAALLKISDVEKLTNDVAVLRQSLSTSTELQLNAEGTMVKPIIKTERNTIIIRQVPAGKTEADIQALFDSAECGTVSKVWSDVGSVWFVMLSSEEHAIKALEHLGTKRLDGQIIKARLKSESVVLHSVVPSAAVANTASPDFLSNPSVQGYAPYNPLAFNQGGFFPSGGAGYGGAAAGGYGFGMDQNVDPNFTGNLFNNRRLNNAGPVPRYNPGFRPAPAAGERMDDASKRKGSGTTTAAVAGVPAGGKGGENNNNTGAAKGLEAQRKGEKKGATAAPATVAAPAAPAPGRKGSKTKSGIAVPQFANNDLFPPLPGGGKATKSGYEGAFAKYEVGDILHIVKTQKDLSKPASLTTDPAHASVVNKDANTQLVASQRTESMDQALAHGRPIRSASVDSLDYESMVYGGTTYYGSDGSGYNSGSDAAAYSTGGYDTTYSTAAYTKALLSESASVLEKSVAAPATAASVAATKSSPAKTKTAPATAGPATASASASTAESSTAAATKAPALEAAATTPAAPVFAEKAEKPKGYAAALLKPAAIPPPSATPAPASLKAKSSASTAASSGSKDDKGKKAGGEKGAKSGESNKDGSSKKKGKSSNGIGPGSKSREDEASGKGRGWESKSEGKSSGESAESKPVVASGTLSNAAPAPAWGGKKSFVEVLGKDAAPIPAPVVIRKRVVTEEEKKAAEKKDDKRDGKRRGEKKGSTPRSAPKEEEASTARAAAEEKEAAPVAAAPVVEEAPKKAETSHKLDITASWGDEV